MRKATTPRRPRRRRGRQVQRFHGLLKDRVRDGQAVVVAGDLNAGPKRPTLDPLYRLTRDGGAGGGLFDEADQTDPRRESFVEEGVRCAAHARTQMSDPWKKILISW